MSPMAMGKRKSVEPPLFFTCNDLPQSEGHPYYVMINRILAESEFDRFVESACQKFYADKMGRPSVAPGVYFRMLLIGYFEGLDSERGIAWRCADSLSLRQFLGMGLDQSTPDHSSVSRTRRLIDLQTHQQVFQFVLHLLAQKKLVKGKTIGVDSTTLEANAAMKSIVRRDTGETYEQFLTKLAQASGIATPTREDLARIDKDRKNKGSNEDWEHPWDPDAKITKMKDGTTHLAHKAEHAVDMDSGAIVSVSLHDASKGDTNTLLDTIVDATANLRPLVDDKQLEGKASQQWMSEVVTDKGYHSNQTLVDLETINIRSYMCEPRRGRRKWTDNPEAKAAVHANRRRMRSKRGIRLRRKRGELLERPNAHCYETGRMRHLYLRKRENILKRLLVHDAGCNLSLLMRKLFGYGTPRSLQGAVRAFFATLGGLLMLLMSTMRRWGVWSDKTQSSDRNLLDRNDRAITSPEGRSATFTTGC
jgi:transposase